MHSSLYTIHFSQHDPSFVVLHWESRRLPLKILPDQAYHDFPQSRAFMNSSSVKDNILAASKCIFHGDQKQNKNKVSIISHWALYSLLLLDHTFCLFNISISFSCFLNPTMSSAFCFSNFLFSACNASILWWSWCAESLRSVQRELLVNIFSWGRAW